MKKVTVAFALLLLPLICFAASNTTPNEMWNDKTVQIAAPVDVDGWVNCVTFSTCVTRYPYRPALAQTTGVRTSTWTYHIDIYMRNHTGVQVRAKYARAATLTTDPVIAVWGYRTGGWSILKDAAATPNRTFTLADTAATDTDDGVTYKWTDPTAKLDAVGAYKIRVTVITAAVESAAGAVTLEITRY